jgi:hypothetical protein
MSTRFIIEAIELIVQGLQILGVTVISIAFLYATIRAFLHIRQPNPDAYGRPKVFVGKCVQERVPAGTAGVLINQSHTYGDLVLPMNETEKQWCGAIDGEHCIGQIIESASPSVPRNIKPDFARRFFERLWWYDQVVFDAVR